MGLLLLRHSENESHKFYMEGVHVLVLTVLSCTLSLQISIQLHLKYISQSTQSDLRLCIGLFGPGFMHFFVWSVGKFEEKKLNIENKFKIQWCVGFREEVERKEGKEWQGSLNRYNICTIRNFNRGHPRKHSAAFQQLIISCTI